MERENKCGITFICGHPQNKCTYCVGDVKGRCKYADTYECESKVAQVNIAVLFLKEQGIEVSNIN